MMNEHDVGGYVSMPCEQYAKLELAIMHHERLRLAWRDRHGGSFVGVLAPLDLETDEGAEFLVGVLPSGEQVRLRLDHIIGFDRV